jgi:hypothetical protein
VGGEHLEAALNSMNTFGCIVVCGLILQYNTAARYPIKNLDNLLFKRLDMQGILVLDIGPEYSEEHQGNMQKWIKDGTFKTLTHETIGIDNAADGLVGLFHGKNYGKAVLKF